MARSGSPTPSDSDSSSNNGFDFMEEPASFRPATPPPTTVPYSRRPHGGIGDLVGNDEVQVRLVSGHPLWGHILYPAAIAMSTFLELHADTLLRAGSTQDGKGKGRAKNVLELGAGGGLPGLVAALEGAANVVISDFPDPALVKNLEANVEGNIRALGATEGVAKTVAAVRHSTTRIPRKDANQSYDDSKGYTWGSPSTILFDSLPAGERFDVLLLSDLVFNHSQHAALLDTCLSVLSASSPPNSTTSTLPSGRATLNLPPMDLSDPTKLSTPIILCFFSHHRPQFVEADLGLLAMAKSKGWTGWSASRLIRGTMRSSDHHPPYQPAISMSQSTTTALRTGLGARLCSTDVSATAFAELPIIDLGALAGNDRDARLALAAELQNACISTGFFYIKNHGVPQKVIDTAFEQAKVFFSQPLEKKMIVDMHKGSSFKGYLPVGGEQVDPDSRGDLHEAFDIGSDAQNFSADKANSGNQYPPAEDLPDFKPAIETAWLDSVPSKTKRSYDEIITFPSPEDYFAAHLTNPGSVMRVLSYPSQAQEGPIDPKELGIGAHTDYECFTLLAQDDVEALQVLNAKGEWIRAPPIKGTFVCNLGDQLQRWTNDVFKSTVHRAINRTGKERQSMPFFFGVNYETKIEVLPSCIGPGRPAKYAPVTAGKYVEGRLAETYVKSG
ncbi:EEF1A N-terminal glycine/lysine methyltransferase, partial [Phenoliferia sp. Uapishka_3]